MSSTATIEPRGRDRRPAVPALLESFPVPPSFIPPTPMLSPASPFPRSASPLPSPGPQASPQHKPPPSAPPSAPLPPVPGPSPITEHETLMFITAARSRRASKISMASVSSYSQRDSIVSASGSSVPSLSPSNSAITTPYDSSRSLRSFPSGSSLSVPGPGLATRHLDRERSPVLQPRIAEDEEDAADLTRMSLDELAMHEPLPEHFSDDEKVLDISISRRRPTRPGHRAHDSISSVDISDIPPLRDDEDGDGDGDGDTPLTSAWQQSESTPTLASTPHVRRSISSASSASGSASGYGVGRQVRRSTDKALPALPPPPLVPPPPPPPSSSHTPPRPLIRSKSQPQRHPAPAQRSGSPDIQEILASTPRPRRKSSHGSGPNSRSTSRSASASAARHHTHAHAHMHVQEVRSAPASRRTSASARSRASAASASSSQGSQGRARRPRSPPELAYAAAYTAIGHSDEESEYEHDYGVLLDSTGTPYDVDMLDGDAEARLDRALDGGGSDSDSSLDLHTPLPQLMVRDGLLSPHSKLVQSSRNTTPLPGDRPGSVFSVASTAGSIMTKGGLFKDERDTTKRRVRHRDGKLLRGGIGLTTGLGWSDSEDEDAPAPLVRQLSTHSLRTRASSSTAHRKPAHDTHLEVDEFGVLPQTQTHTHMQTSHSLPPTAWHRPRPRHTSGSGSGSGPHRMSTTSTSSSLSSMSASSASVSVSALSRALSRTSVTSHRSAPASLTRRDPASLTRRGAGLEPATLSTHALGHIREGDEVGFSTPSTSSSTASLAGPVTPVTPADSPVRLGSGYSYGVKKPAKLDLLSAAELGPRDVVILNSPGSTGQPSPALSPAFSTSRSTPTSASLSTSTSRGAAVPRPLRLPQTQGSVPRTPLAPGARTSAPSALSMSSSMGSTSTSTGSLRRIPSQGLRQPQAHALGASTSASGIAFPSRSPVRPAHTSTPMSVSRSVSGASPSKLRPRTGTGMVYRSTPTPTTSPTLPGPKVPPALALGARPSMLRMPSSASLRSVKGVGVAL